MAYEIQGDISPTSLDDSLLASNACFDMSRRIRWS
jgi:hypothetical protein